MISPDCLSEIIRFLAVFAVSFVDFYPYYCIIMNMFHVYTRIFSIQSDSYDRRSKMPGRSGAAE